MLIRWIASPINPADINQIQGTYEAKPNEFPAVAGNEGCGIVCKVSNIFIYCHW